MKVELTKEQIDKLMAAEEQQLRSKFEKDLAAIRKKYEVVEIDLKTSFQKKTKVKLTEEQFRKYLNEGLSLVEISKKSNYNIGYLYKLRKQLVKD